MNILFMCVANSARSQLAEGLAATMFPSAHIMSAGSQPGKLNPFAVEVLREIGIDISRHYSKSIDKLPTTFMDNLDYIITLCAEEVCPAIVVQNAKKLHWPFPDPATKENLTETDLLIRFRYARDSIEKKLAQFKAETGF